METLRGLIKMVFFSRRSDKNFSNLLVLSFISSRSLLELSGRLYFFISNLDSLEAFRTQSSNFGHRTTRWFPSILLCKTLMSKSRDVSISPVASDGANHCCLFVILYVCNFSGQVLLSKAKSFIKTLCPYFSYPAVISQFTCSCAFVHTYKTFY